MRRFRTISQARKANPKKYKLKKGPNGRNCCRWCGTETRPPRTTFCSGYATTYSRRKQNGVWIKVVKVQGSGCVHEWLIRSSTRYAKDMVFDRDKGICAECGNKHNRKGQWDLDHRQPLWNGGTWDQDNLQILCRPCHKIKTSREAKERAAIKRKKKKLVR